MIFLAEAAAPAATTDLSALVVLLGGAIGAGAVKEYMAWRRAKQARVERERDRQMLYAKLDKTALKQDTLNDSLTQQLQLNAELLRRIADETRDPEDEARAEEMERALSDRRTP